MPDAPAPDSIAVRLVIVAPDTTPPDLSSFAEPIRLAAVLVERGRAPDLSDR